MNRLGFDEVLRELCSIRLEDEFADLCLIAVVLLDILVVANDFFL